MSAAIQTWTGPPMPLSSFTSLNSGLLNADYSNHSNNTEDKYADI